MLVTLGLIILFAGGLSVGLAAGFRTLLPALFGGALILLGASIVVAANYGAPLVGVS